MARSRLNLQAELERILGSEHVYYQPPENIKLRFPAIVYNRDRSWDVWADNKKYLLYKGYMITAIGLNPDSMVLDQIELMDMCTYVRHFIVDGLNHDVFLIYY